MSRTVPRIAGAVLLGLLALACTRLPVAAGGEGFDLLPAGDSIPLAWGQLVGVNENTSVPNVSQLWFQNGTGEIHLVVYNHGTGHFWPKARVIPRR